MQGSEESIVPVFIPPLINILVDIERRKGSPLTEKEVLNTRDQSICLNMCVSRKLALEENRGYQDLDPEHIWTDWLSFRAQNAN
jgi:hypothetical protein